MFEIWRYARQQGILGRRMALQDGHGVLGGEHALVRHDRHRRMGRDKLQAVQIPPLDRLLHQLNVEPLGLHLLQQAHCLAGRPRLVGVDADDGLRRTGETILLQNIGGIGSMTVLPTSAGPEAVYAFDTGPGNMIIDAVISAATGGAQRFDRDGTAAARGQVCASLLEEPARDEYYALPLPKSTGREHFGEQYTARILTYGWEHGFSFDDLAATATELTA